MKTSREKLLIIAFKLFLTKGYAQTSMVDLANASGLSKGAFHYYFPRKHDILEACIEHFFRDFLPDANPDEETCFEDYAHQCGLRYAQALTMLLKHNIPLAAYQSFLWSIVRDDPQAFYERYQNFLEKLSILYTSKSSTCTKTSNATRVSQDLIAIVEGTGNALSLNPQIRPVDIEPAFEAAVDGFLARLNAEWESK